MPNDFATSARDRSDERNNSTASRRNSSGYFDDRPNEGSFPWHHTRIKCPRSRVNSTWSAPGIAQFEVALNRGGSNGYVPPLNFDAQVTTSIGTDSLVRVRGQYSWSYLNYGSGSQPFTASVSLTLPGESPAGQVHCSTSGTLN